MLLITQAHWSVQSPSTNSQLVDSFTTTHHNTCLNLLPLLPSRMAPPTTTNPVPLIVLISAPFVPTAIRLPLTSMNRDILFLTIVPMVYIHRRRRSTDVHLLWVLWKTLRTFTARILPTWWRGLHVVSFVSSSLTPTPTLWYGEVFVELGRRGKITTVVGGWDAIRRSGWGHGFGQDVQI
jgi:hypothetical protein